MKMSVIPNYSSGDVDKAADKESGGRRLARRIVAHLKKILQLTINLVLANLGVHLVHPHEVAALPVHALRDASVVVETLHRARADTVLAEVVGVQVVLGCHLP